MAAATGSGRSAGARPEETPNAFTERPVRLSLRRVLAFIAVFTAINQLVARCASEQVLRWMIEVATVQPAAWVARQIEGNATITTSGSQLRAADGIINVRYGCEGSDVLMLLAAALIAAPIAWRRRLGGLLAGAAVVFVLNQARVLALFYAVRVGSPWFGPLHGLIAPLAVVLAVSLFFLWWIRRPLAAVGRV